MFDVFAALKAKTYSKTWSWTSLTVH